MIGHELGGRYEILARIGEGGMALVYKAHDILLGRNVAVKVLRQQFVHDEEFVRRFRREAQSAAALSHPNVVSIYDVGQEDETHYIVMEYVEGSNLNEIIAERAPLQTEEAVRIAMQICDALEHAHYNQIIHRDIKPHNILIGKNGRVKVTDFGIARAVTSSTITQAGSVVGSVHYFSPEHAKGVSTGEKSDLYSLGIVLYQMLTGKLPFLGESPISVALKHLQERFEEPRVVNPHIPQSLENIILRSMRKNPGERYGSAVDMLRDLESCLDAGRLNETKLHFHDDMEDTRVMPAIRGGAIYDAPAERTTVEQESYASRQPQEGQARTQGKRWIKPVVMIGGTLLVLGLLFFGLRMFLSDLDTSEVDVPYVVGKTLTQARSELEAAGLKVEDPIIYEASEKPKEEVIQQSKQNMIVKTGTYLRLYVSSGPQMEEMQNYVDQKYSDVRDNLLTLGLTADQIKSEEVFSDKPAGTILSQSPVAGEQFRIEQVAIRFEVSKGLEMVAMPNLVGRTQKEAINLIRDNELRLGPGNGIVEEPSFEPAGTVLEQFPHEAGTEVAKGAEVSITVSSGLPADARQFTFNINVSPAQAGGTSEVKVVYSDATGQNIECCKQTISDWTTIPVKVTLGPGKEAQVMVYRDGELADVFTRTYDQVQAGASQGESVPGMAPQEPEPPVEQPAEPQEPEQGAATEHGGANQGESHNSGGNHDEQG